MPYFELIREFRHSIRIWLNDMPMDALLSNETTHERRIFNSGTTTVLQKRIAVEIFQPYGSMFHHGLLGGEYQPIDGNKLEVIVPVDTPFPKQHYTNAFASPRLDTVMVGGLPEYTDAIFNGIEKVETNNRPCGVLNITCMTHGEVYSAPVVFNWLAWALLHLLSQSDQPALLDEAIALLSESGVQSIHSLSP